MSVEDKLPGSINLDRVHFGSYPSCQNVMSVRATHVVVRTLGTGYGMVPSGRVMGIYYTRQNETSLGDRGRFHALNLDTAVTAKNRNCVGSWSWGQTHYTRGRKN